MFLLINQQWYKASSEGPEPLREATFLLNGIISCIMLAISMRHNVILLSPASICKTQCRFTITTKTKAKTEHRSLVITIWIHMEFLAGLAG